jgi:hypothetical protein
MRRILVLVVLPGTFAALASIVAPTSAHAGFVIEGSVGKGVMVKPDVAATQTTIMAAPGWAVLSMLRLQLGVVGALGDVKNSKFDLELRPMLTVAPPVLPVYGRLVFAAQNLLDSDRRQFAYGPVIGVSFGLLGLSVFAEAGLLPRNAKLPMDRSQMQWVVEGRVGAGYSF